MTDNHADPKADHSTPPPTNESAADYVPDGSGGDTSGGGADAVIVLGQD